MIYNGNGINAIRWSTGGERVVVNVNGTAAVIAAKENSPLSSLPAAASIDDQSRTSVIIRSRFIIPFGKFSGSVYAFTHVATKPGSVRIARNDLVLSGGKHRTMQTQ